MIQNTRPGIRAVCSEQSNTGKRGMEYEGKSLLYIGNFWKNTGGQNILT